jgi:SPP1 family predicted phage head-tail adaptor
MPIDVAAGKFRHWLTLERKVEDLDSDGATVEEWIRAFELNPRMPCDVVDLSARDLIAAQAMQSKVQTRIRCRYRHGIEAVQRLVAADGTIYRVQGIVADPLTRRTFVTFLCSSGTSSG